MKVAYKEPGKPARIEEIDGTLESFRKLLNGGWLESVPAPMQNAVMFCDDEGLMKGLDPNLFHLTLGTIVGPVILVEVDSEGQEVGIEEERLELAKRFLDVSGELLKSQLEAMN